MITGFQATMSVDDGGTGATSGADTAFSGLVTFNLPSLEAGKFDATELNQADVYERELPTGLVKVGPNKATMKFNKANYQRLHALLGDRGHTWKLVSPDDQTTPGTPVKLTVTFTGFLSKVDEVAWDKAGAAVIPFEITVTTGLALT